jgi:hypothetical protein
MTRRPLLLLLLAVFTLVPAASRAHDDDDDDDEREASHEKHRGRGSDASARAAPGWKPYVAECGSCHLAFPPAMLPAASWKRLVGTLDDHFGQNAEVDAATRAQLDAFLAAFAGAPRADAPLRITQTGWWRHEHDELRADVYQRKAVGTPANCPACHVNADQGDFRERGVKIPR